MKVSEIFFSIQGESTFTGLPCIFIRLAGCNLRCAYCDTTYAQTFEEGYELAIDDILKEIKKFRCRLVEVTGGEPLIQEETRFLLDRLLGLGYTVLLETNGSVSLKDVNPGVIKVVDVKCPGSGQGGSFLMDNLKSITPADEVKFVIMDRRDYEFARDFILKIQNSQILFSPAHPRMNPEELARWILKDGLEVRLQPQMHRYIWGERCP
ncbi:MAG: radical SAM protein [Deltaproteobacteria bacterium]|nr:radical SAM protein [Deltaproteobacteria bacterium]